MSKIVVVASSYDQFRYWIRHNIVPVVSQQDLDRLQGVELDRLYFEGTCNDWLDDRASDFLHALLTRSKVPGKDRIFCKKSKIDLSGGSNA